MREWSPAAADEAARRWVRRTGAEAEVAHTWLVRTVGPSPWFTGVLDDDAYRAGLFEGARRITLVRDDPRWGAPGGSGERWALLVGAMAAGDEPGGVWPRLVRRVRRRRARRAAGGGALGPARSGGADGDHALRYRRGIAGALIHAAHHGDDPPPCADAVRRWELELLAAGEGPRRSR